jgi:hypothetical protein
MMRPVVLLSHNHRRDSIVGRFHRFQTTAVLLPPCVRPSRPFYFFQHQRAITSTVQNLCSSLCCHSEVIGGRCRNIPYEGTYSIRNRFYQRQPFSNTTIVDDTNSNNHNSNLQRQYELLRHITHSTRSLGVWEAIELLYSTSTIQQRQNTISNVWESIRQLPELETAILNLKLEQPLSSSSNIESSIQALERAVQIFGSYRSGSMEHVACFALLAEFQNRNNAYTECSTTLNELLRAYNDTHSAILNDVVQLGLAKLHWFHGHHELAKEICDSLVDRNRPIEAAARTGQAVSRLSLVSSLDDVFSVRDPFRMTIKRLEHTAHPASTVLAAAYLNMGVAEAVWAETVSKHNEVDAPLDAAMRNWKQGLTTLKKGNSKNSISGATLSSSSGHRTGESSSLRSILQARLLANMAWGMLQKTNELDYVSRAVEFASESLAIYDALGASSTTAPVDATADKGELSVVVVEKEGLGRTLSVLGTCYHLDGNAVTAQGLLQSALDKVPMRFSSSTITTTASVLQCIEQRDTYLRYANLCQDWDQREGDAKQMHQKANDIDSFLLPDGWSDKSPIHGSLWFWTSAISQRH